MKTPYYEHAGVTIYHGDVLDVLPKVGPADVGFADPPYNVGLKYDGYEDTLPPDAYEAWCGWWFHHLRARTDRTFVTCGYVNAAQWAKRGPNGLAAWYKPGNPAGAGIFQFCEWEPIFVWGTGRIGGSDVIRATVGTQRSVGDHPCPKPLALLKQLLDRARGKSVIDPFMGSGTTLVAAKWLGMTAVGIEQSERYCEIAAKRLGQEVLDLEEVS